MSQTPTDKADAETGTDKLPKTARGRRTREAILDAAIKEFGERGYSDASIARITDRAGVALGSFYTYFDSKDALFTALVAYMGHLTRKRLSMAVAKATDRMEAERLGLAAYIDLVRERPEIYNIINQAQFVAPEAYAAHYRGFTEAYRDNLRRAAVAGEIRPGDEELRAWALIGMSVFLGMRYGQWDISRPAEEIAAEAIDLIGWGIAP